MRQHRAPGRPDLWSAGQHDCSYGLPLATHHTTELPSEGGREKGRVIYTDIKWFWCTTGGRSTGLMWPSSLHSRPSEADSTPQRPNLPDLALHITHDQRCLQTSPARSQPLKAGFLPARNMRPGNGLIFIACLSFGIEELSFEKVGFSENSKWCNFFPGVNKTKCIFVG